MLCIATDALHTRTLGQFLSKSGEIGLHIECGVLADGWRVLCQPIAAAMASLIPQQFQKRPMGQQLGVIALQWPPARVDFLHRMRRAFTLEWAQQHQQTA